MALESATYIDGLVTANPTGGDAKSQGDDHIRLIKTTIKNTFPNISGAVNATHTELNLLDGVVATGIGVPIGGIILWSGSIATIPTGWQLCNGTNATPDLRDRFVICADADSGGDYNVNSTGGATTTSSNGANTPTITVNSHILVESELPSHTHGIQLQRTDGTGITAGSTGCADSAATDTTDDVTDGTGGGGGHTHTASSSEVPAHTHTITPPYYALAYIQRLT
jgi:microcystin-dependent protein